MTNDLPSGKLGLVIQHLYLPFGTQEGTALTRPSPNIAPFNFFDLREERKNYINTEILIYINYINKQTYRCWNPAQKKPHKVMEYLWSVSGGICGGNKERGWNLLQRRERRRRTSSKDPNPKRCLSTDDAWPTEFLQYFVFFNICYNRFWVCFKTIGHWLLMLRFHIFIVTSSKCQVIWRSCRPPRWYQSLLLRNQSSFAWT